jgi:hypothetical protein
MPKSALLAIEQVKTDDGCDFEGRADGTGGIAAFDAVQEATRDARTNRDIARRHPLLNPRFAEELTEQTNRVGRVRRERASSLGHGFVPSIDQDALRGLYIEHIS